MKDVANLKIHRWINFSNSNSSIELHAFSDASIKAYAAVVYICTTNETGERHVAILEAKTKVAPIKTISLPRLELCAAVLASKLMQYVIHALKLTQTFSIHTWTDSEIVLAWLRGHPSKWTTFIANRVSHIHNLLGENMWSYVPSKENPADCASRGLYPDDLKKHSLWWTGPEWLKKSKEYWPTRPEGSSTHLEQRKVHVHHINAENEMESKYSSLTKLLRVTAYCKRFLRNLRTLPASRKKDYLTAAEIEDSLQFWLKRIQHNHFSGELSALEKGKSVDHKSRLLKLNPFIDAYGLIRVGGRLRHSDLSYDERHTIILPDRGHHHREGP